MSLFPVIIEFMYLCVLIDEFNYAPIVSQAWQTFRPIALDMNEMQRMENF